jgi:hypothetical protein
MGLSRPQFHRLVTASALDAHSSRTASATLMLRGSSGISHALKKWASSIGTSVHCLCFQQETPGKAPAWRESVLSHEADQPRVNAP